MAHTPGPWRVSDRAIMGPDRSDIADCDFITRGTEETYANCDLIAAAPDRLDAIKGLIDFIEIDKLPMNADALRIARAAIAKATP